MFAVRKTFLNSLEEMTMYASFMGERFEAD
jgi:hypothetical protein